MPKVSVILPLYNCERYIGEAVESILNQTLCDFELLVINEPGSPTETIERYAAVDDRIRIIQKTRNQGLPYSLNIGLEQASGEYIARMDSDDVSLPNRLETQVAFMDAHPDIDICGSNVVFIGDGEKNEPRQSNLPLDDGDIKAMLLFGCALAHPTVMFRAASIRKYGMQYDNTASAEDYELWVRMARRVKYANIECPLLKYRQHSSNLSLNPEIAKSAAETSRSAMKNIGISLTEDETEFLFTDILRHGWLRQLRVIRSLRKKFFEACIETDFCSAANIEHAMKRFIKIKRTPFTGWLLGVVGYYMRELTAVFR